MIWPTPAPLSLVVRCVLGAVCSASPPHWTSTSKGESKETVMWSGKEVLVPVCQGATSNKIPDCTPHLLPTVWYYERIFSLVPSPTTAHWNTQLTEDKHAWDMHICIIRCIAWQLLNWSYCAVESVMNLNSVGTLITLVLFLQMTTCSASANYSWLSFR